MWSFIADNGIAGMGIKWDIQFLSLRPLRALRLKASPYCHPEGAKRPKDLPLTLNRILRYAQDDNDYTVILRERSD
jgi:hypothetical protein